ncbi:methylated-DNA--[protein]-cysteine S-methyltransferase [Ureibacillus thermophilus]|uniref:Methylated-DNA--protein-cysteine methyltransferase n=2 Tax=Ureibacillus thermophilus TaxID=367743 RepID=A0A4P6UWS5_9BACL|nr:methylated-DNA--[protein]-cysteine S-methyltransferase [Ureibacillus thermophilus]QBK26132.1 methylated-DNA--[protein]-cysteine S-methyltransferase [Ureibacillus thermophilus]
MMEKKIYAANIQHPYMNLYIAASEKGLVYIGTEHSSMEELVKYCQKQFPHYEIIENEAFLKTYITQLKEYLNGERQEFTLPFDIQGTPFQQKVWKALCEIPFGKTATYSEVANRINQPKAVRAVGGAIGRNPLSIVIPCHRVLGKNGRLTGYSGGLDVKMRLLDLEGIPYQR